MSTSSLLHADAGHPRSSGPGDRHGPKGLPRIDRGIDQVVRAEPAPPSVAAMLSARFAPAEMPAGSQLERLFASYSLSDYLNEALEPRISQALVLSPLQFQQALEHAQRLLRERAEAEPRQARTLNAAARQLAHHAALGQLLQMYRNALLQG